MAETHDHDHHHHDPHSHAPEVNRDNERKILVSFFLIFSFMLVEAIGGYVSGSLALIADAGHMLTDAVALGLAYAAFRFGRREADGKRTFGYLRFEVIAGFVNALTLFGIVLWIFIEAYQRFRNPPEVLAGPMLIIAAFGFFVNLLVLYLLTRGDREHVNVKGAILHVIGDLLGSAAAILAALVIYFTGWTPIDPILSIFVSLLVLRSAWKLLGRSLHILLEGAPDNAMPQDIERYLVDHIEGVEAVSHTHVWLITSGYALATMHVRPSPGADLRLVVRRVEKALEERFDIGHSTIAINWDDADGNPCRFMRLPLEQNQVEAEPLAHREGGEDVSTIHPNEGPSAPSGEEPT